MDKKNAKKTAEAAANVTAHTVGGVFRTVMKVVATILLVIITTGLLFTCIFAYYVKTSLSQNLDISLEDMTLNLASSILYTDSNGESKELVSLHSLENRVWVDYENIPIYMEYAAVAIEDKRFYDHKGVDWYRTFGAFVNMFATMKDDFGGSTLTQQLLKNITKDDDITVQRKLLEIFRALELERMYTKEEIVEWYLNVIFLGQGSYGVGTAAQTYFGKNVWDLSLAECASIIGITNNPSKYDPFISKSNNKERQETILWQMYEQGYIKTYEEYEAAVNEELVFVRGEKEEPEMEIYTYYEEAVISDVVQDLMEAKGINKESAEYLLYNGGLQIHSFYNENYQNIMDNIYQDPSQFPAYTSPKGESMQSAAILMDPYTGAILALQGGIGEKTSNLVFNRATDARRPPGSSIKPIATYGPAVDQNLITPSTMVNDSATGKLSGTNWWPKNAGGGNRGIITIETALINSLNTVSAQILDKLSVNQSYEYLTNHLGMKLEESDRDYAPLALGQLTYGATVREMCQAFGAFVNDGIFTYGRTYSHITDSEGNMILDNQPETIVAFKANTAWVMTYMLNKAASYGTGAGTSLTNMPHAGKTGSSTNYEDRWFVGYTPYYVCAVWSGYDTPAYLTSGTNPSAVTWRKIMQPVHEGLEYRSFKTPTLGAPTNIFGNLKESPEPSPSESPDESPSESPSESPVESPSESPTTPPSPSTPVSPPPTESQAPESTPPVISPTVFPSFSPI